MKAKINSENIYSYIIGNLRYKIYYSSMFQWLMQGHIKEQIDFRIKIMDKECYNQGSCKLCGCSTTALQMADKSCDKPCYPKMMDFRRWQNFKDGFITIDKGGAWVLKGDILEHNGNNVCGIKQQ